MTVETFGPAAVQARIASIQSRFAATPAASTVASSRGTTSGAGTGASTLTGSRAAEFAAALARLNGAMPETATASASGAPDLTNQGPHEAGPGMVRRGIARAS